MKKEKKKQCVMKGCQREAFKNDFCRKHYFKEKRKNNDKKFGFSDDVERALISGGEELDAALTKRGFNFG